MSAPEEFRVGDDRLLCDEWHGRDRTVVLRPGDPHTPVRATTVVQVLELLGTRGVTRVLTAALDPRGIAPFAAAGFAPHEDLAVLCHRLDDIPRPAGSCRIRRGSARRDLRVAATIDGTAFAARDALDPAGLRRVLGATSITRFRLAGADRGAPGGYAVAGIAGARGYIQRIAVDPAQRRRGLAHALVIDALGWFRRRQVTEAYVNTQVDNDAARALYRGAGFVPTDRHLAVWAWNRPGPP